MLLTAVYPLYGLRHLTTLSLFFGYDDVMLSNPVLSDPIPETFYGLLILGSASKLRPTNTHSWNVSSVLARTTLGRDAPLLCLFFVQPYLEVLYIPNSMFHWTTILVTSAQNNREAISSGTLRSAAPPSWLRAAAPPIDVYDPRWCPPKSHPSRTAWPDMVSILNVCQTHVSDAEEVPNSFGGAHTVLFVDPWARTSPSAHLTMRPLLKIRWTLFTSLAPSSLCF